MSTSVIHVNTIYCQSLHYKLYSGDGSYSAVVTAGRGGTTC